MEINFWATLTSFALPFSFRYYFYFAIVTQTRPESSNPAMGYEEHCISCFLRGSGGWAQPQQHELIGRSHMLVSRRGTLFPQTCVQFQTAVVLNQNLKPIFFSQPSTFSNLLSFLFYFRPLLILVMHLCSYFT